jgi:uncharacterized Rmd1/YagE family protein
MKAWWLKCLNDDNDILIFFLQVMNEKLNHCCELMELIDNKVNDARHVRLEWMIIILIMVEVRIILIQRNQSKPKHP